MRRDVCDDDRRMAPVAGRTPADDLAERAFERELSDAMAGRPRWPEGAAFVSADVPELASVISRYGREGRPVVLVYPDGRELLIHFDRKVPSVVAGLKYRARLRFGLLRERLGTPK